MPAGATASHRATTARTAAIVHVEGDLKVHVPVVGRSVERVIVNDLRQYIVDEVSGIPDLRDEPQAACCSQTLSIWVIPSSIPPARTSMSAVVS